MGGVAFSQIVGEEQRKNSVGEIESGEYSDWERFHQIQTRMLPNTLPAKFWPSQLRPQKMNHKRKT
jgi:hypothetical protein